ncbi:MAG TPA: hypothetical protein VFW33_15035 [Gemmataceae bacterium]|nr:hypothetical protein [Gemmataceae bacterium]
MGRNSVKSVVAVALLSLLGTAPRAAAGNDLPLKGSFTFQTVSSSAPDEYGNVVQQIVGEGTASHLGRSTVSATHVLNLFTGQFTSTFTVTAANGDKAYGTAEGQIFPDGSFEETLQFNGGTGRFANATGSATGTGELDFVTQEATETLVGTISGVGGK